MLLTGTDWDGRRELERRYQGLSVKERRIREIRMAQYSGFVMRGDGTLAPLWGRNGRICWEVEEEPNQWELVFEIMWGLLIYLYPLKNSWVDNFWECLGDVQILGTFEIFCNCWVYESLISCQCLSSFKFFNTYL
jgi:hypothetical protein